MVYIFLVVIITVTNLVSGDKNHWDAKLYENHSKNLQQASALELVKQLVFIKGEHILDIGCGEGKITKEIALAHPSIHLVGIDINQTMIELAQKQYQAANIEYQVMSAENIKLPLKFDRVLSFFCLQWVPNKKRAFQQIAQYLKVGGTFHIIVTDRNESLKKARLHLIAQQKWSNYFKNYKDSTRFIDDDRYVYYCQSNNLRVISFEEKPKVLTFQTKHELRSFIKMVTAALTYVPKNMQDEFINELVHLYQEELIKNGEEQNTITYMVKVIHGFKI